MMTLSDHKFFKAYLNDIGHYARITRKEEKELGHVIQTSPNKRRVAKAREKFILSNLHLVVNRALLFYNQYCKQYGNFITINDLISEGNKGLMNAVDLFDPNKNNTFGTYAVRAIDRKILRFYQNFLFVIRIPNHHFKALRDIRDVKSKYGNDVSEKVILKKAKITKILYDILKHEDYIRPENIRDADKYVEILSSNENLGLALENNNIRDYLISKINRLQPIHRDVIFLRFFDEEVVSIEKMAKYFGVTRQAVHRRYDTAMKRLRRMIERDIKDPEIKKIINRR